MYCRECGKEIPEGSSFCPSCGRYLDTQQYQTSTYSSASYTYTAPAPQRKKNYLGKIIAVAVIIIFVAMMFSPTVTNEEKGQLSGQSFTGSFSDSAIYADDTRLAIFTTSGFDNNDATVSFIDFENEGVTYNNSCRLTLSEEIQNQYGLFKYIIQDLGTLEKTEPYITIYKSVVGSYQVSVECRNDPSDTPLTYVFEFYVAYWCPYEWSYDGGTFSFETFVKYSELVTYLPTEETVGERSVTDYSLSTDYIVVDPIVTGIYEELKDLYTKAYGHCYLDQDFANFILGFVQCNFTYCSDMLLYTQGEYFAYPLQTLAFGAGDCEDTSILCAAIYKAAGYSAAILLLPGHAMAGVAIEDYVSPSIGNDAEILHQKVNGKTYYACETTLDSYQPVGISSTSGQKYSNSLDKGYVGYGSFTFYTCG